MVKQMLTQEMLFGKYDECRTWICKVNYGDCNSETCSTCSACTINNYYLSRFTTKLKDGSGKEGALPKVRLYVCRRFGKGKNTRVVGG